MKTIDDLRATLADVIKDVRSGKLDINQARAINELSKSIIDTAKVEVDYAKHTDTQASEFVAGESRPALPGAGAGGRGNSHRAERTITETAPGVRRIVNRI